jgi:hypothetical protein
MHLGAEIFPSPLSSMPPFSRSGMRLLGAEKIIDGSGMKASDHVQVIAYILEEHAYSIREHDHSSLCGICPSCSLSSAL